MASGDDEEATPLELAASQGNAEAQAELGDMHYLGDGVPQDFAEARRLFYGAGRNQKLWRARTMRGKRSVQ